MDENYNLENTEGDLFFWYDPNTKDLSAVSREQFNALILRSRQEEDDRTGFRTRN